MHPVTVAVTGMAPSFILGQDPGVNETRNSEIAATLHRTKNWVAATHAFKHPPTDYQDLPGGIPSDIPPETVATPSDEAPSICDSLSHLSDISDGSEVRQEIDHAAGSNIGRSFLASYNRADTWVIQLLGKQARLVLVSLFSIGCLPSKLGQDAQQTSSGCQKDMLSTIYSEQLWGKLGPKGYLWTLLKARAASLQLISMLEQQIEAAFSINGLYDLDEMIADFQQEWALGQADDTA